MTTDMKETGREPAEDEPTRSTNEPDRSGSQPRVSVTPNDWRKLEALSDELGLPYSKVYNVSFQALLEKLGHKGHAE